MEDFSSKPKLDNFLLSDATPTGELNSPPLEGWPQAGVVNIPQAEFVHASQAELASTSLPEILTTINGTPNVRSLVENLPYNHALYRLAKDKRKAGILSEVLFW